ncbi:MAG: triose-phosphate isomerase [Chitinophagales bacterium]|nr:triose-phosphate isomerase [Chitinophagales bacterium]MDW8418518.1 triose-phosphate isomerase [Chitinophagales bacterium]
MARKKLVAANWKMNLTLEQAAEWLADVDEMLQERHADVVVFPSYVFITDLMDMYEGDLLLFGAQNCSHVESGALTGEVSAMQLASVGIDYVIIGHSERRTYFGETNEIIRQKLKVAVKHELLPVFCCGEPLEIRNQGKQQEYVLQQLRESLFDLSPAEIADVTIAYEPVWAIGTGINATPGQAQEMHSFIRGQIEERYGKQISGHIRILYGGSCKPDNAAEIFACPDVDGGLIGGASLKADDFVKIVMAAAL